MPMGTPHEIEGLLLERKGGLVLDIRDGGAWRLNAGRLARVIRIRDGFDLLAVKTIEAIHE